MYRKIKQHDSTLTKYAQRLVREGLISDTGKDEQVAAFRAKLDADFEAAESFKPNKADWLDGAWSGLKVAEGPDGARRGRTGVPMEELKTIGQASPAYRTTSMFTGRSSALWITEPR